MKIILSILISALLATQAFGFNMNNFLGGYLLDTTTEVCIETEYAHLYPYVRVCYATEPETQWIGLIVTASENEYSKTFSFLPDTEIGLRSDGVVVWRTKPKKEVTP